MAKYIKYPILAAITTLMALEMWIAFEGFIPIEYESSSMALLLCTTILVWVGVMGLIGVVSPVDYRTLKIAYVPLAILLMLIYEFVVFVIVFFWFVALPVSVTLSSVAILGFLSVFWMRRSDTNWIRKLISSAKTIARTEWIPILLVLHLIVVLLWIAEQVFFPLPSIPGLTSLSQYSLLVVVGLASMLAIVGRGEHTPIGYSLVVVFPLLLFAWVGLSSMFYPATYGLQYWLITVFFFLMASALIASLILWLKTGEMSPNLVFSGLIVFGLFLTVLGSFVLSDIGIVLYLMLLPAAPLLLLLSLRVTALLNQIGHPYRNIVASTIALCAMIAVTGWYWTYRIPNGLDAFTGQERVAAEDALYEAHCDDAPSYPAARRVVKNDSGEFRVLGYTWWGFPSRAPSCVDGELKWD